MADLIHTTVYFHPLSSSVLGINSTKPKSLSLPFSQPPTPHMCLQFPSRGLWFNDGIIPIRLKPWSIVRDAEARDKTTSSAPTFGGGSLSMFGVVGRKSYSLGCGSLKWECHAGPNHIMGAIFCVKLSLSIWAMVLWQQAMPFFFHISVLIGSWYRPDWNWLFAAGRRETPIHHAEEHRSYV